MSVGRLAESSTKTSLGTSSPSSPLVLAEKVRVVDTRVCIAIKV